METVITEHAPNQSKKIFRGKSYNAVRAKGADPWRWGGVARGPCPAHLGKLPKILSK